MTHPNMFRGLDLTAQIRDLVADLVADRVAIGAPSVYETGRLVTLVPWLDGHARRIRFLLDAQRQDGSWGGPGGYAAVPTLSAVEALMAVLDRGAPRDASGDASGETSGETHGETHGERQDELRRACGVAVERGLRAAAALPAEVAVSPPATAGAAMVIAALTEAIGERAERAGGRRPLPATSPGASGAAGAEQLARLRGGAWRIPLLSHYLELVGPGVVGAREIRPVDGTVCGSAAATAAWLGPVRPRRSADPAVRSAVRMLTDLQGRYGGPVPAFTSQVFVAQAWSLGHLALAGVGGTVLAELRDALAAAPTQEGIGLPGGPGLPADSDTTAVGLFALGRLGVARDPDHLWAYDTGAHFVTVHPETEASTSANAHILMALGDHAARGGPAAGRCAAAAARIATWLGDQQRVDGGWLDKWHASPFYATRSCAIAVHRYGGPERAIAVHRAVRWVLDMQRVDGSWGRWRSTAEETAYAVQTLLHAGGRDPAVARAAARGCRFLLRHHQRGSAAGHHPPLFHGKDLVSIPGLVRAAVLAALELGRRNPDIAERAETEGI